MMMKITVCIGSSCHIKGSRQVVEQLQGDAGVLGGDEIAGLQRLNGAGGKVGQIADGGAHQRQSTAMGWGHRVSPAFG